MEEAGAAREAAGAEAAWATASATECLACCCAREPLRPQSALWRARWSHDHDVPEEQVAVVSGSGREALHRPFAELCERGAGEAVGMSARSRVAARARSVCACPSSPCPSSPLLSAHP